MNGSGCGPIPRLHLCIEGPGQNLPMIAGAIEEVPDEVKDSMQDGRFTVLHNATGVGHRKQRVAEWEGGREVARGQHACNREDTKAEESGAQKAERWGRDH